MIGFFTCFGLAIFAFGLIFGLTALCGWMADDHDHMLRWILSSLIAAGLATALIMTNIQ
jgi:hypothetical protein